MDVVGLDAEDDPACAGPKPYPESRRPSVDMMQATEDGLACGTTKLGSPPLSQMGNRDDLIFAPHTYHLKERSPDAVQGEA